MLISAIPGAIQDPAECAEVAKLKEKVVKLEARNSKVGELGLIVILYYIGQPSSLEYIVHYLARWQGR